MLTAEGDREVFQVDPADVPKLGIKHLSSHAGLTDVGFRVYYDEVDGQRYIQFSHEIPPPTAER